VPVVDDNATHTRLIALVKENFGRTGGKNSPHSRKARDRRSRGPRPRAKKDAGKPYSPLVCPDRRPSMPGMSARFRAGGAPSFRQNLNLDRRHHPSTC